MGGGWGEERVEGLSKKEKGLMDMDFRLQCGDCWGEGCTAGLKGNGKIYNKD